jgi:hypothetical protein
VSKPVFASLFLSMRVVEGRGIFDVTRPMQMPDEQTLPEGPHRDFVALLFDYYRLARRPALEKICNQIQSADRAGTASRETIRRLMNGVSVPPNWQTVEAIFVALCELAGVTHDVRVKAFDHRADEWVVTDRRSQMEAAWNAALDGRHPDGPGFLGVDFETAQPLGFGGTARPAPPSDNPWATGGGFSDDPPF